MTVDGIQPADIVTPRDATELAAVLAAASAARRLGMERCCMAAGQDRQNRAC